MKVHFRKIDVEKVYEHSKAHQEQTTVYGEQCVAGDLMLVGDEGVYLMSTAEAVLLRPGEKEGSKLSFAAYAMESNPNEQEFEEWWHGKNNSFGEDDGYCRITEKTVKELLHFGNETYVAMDISEESVCAAKPDLFERKMLPAQRRIGFRITDSQGT